MRECGIAEPEVAGRAIIFRYDTCGRNRGHKGEHLSRRRTWNTGDVHSIARTFKPLTVVDLITEAHVEQTCGDWLQLDGWVCLKTDPVSNPKWGKGFGELGMADCQYRRPFGKSIPNPLYDSCSRSVTNLMWIEWKKRKGQLAAHQAAWRQGERDRGFLAVAAGMDFPKTIAGFMEWYRKSGLMRRQI